MELKVGDVAKLLNVSEKTIYRWIKDGSIPAYKISEQFRFSRMEILEWATSRKMPVTAEVYEEQDGNGHHLTISDALLEGGIVHNLKGADKTEVLHNAVIAMNLPKSVDREHLLQLLIARESLASTAIGDGLAIPHVRHPIVMHISHPTITACFLEHPVDFGAIDAKPVHCLFMMVSPTVRSHLQLISRLAFTLKDSKLRAVIERHGTRDEVFAELKRIESAMGWAGTPPVTA